MRDISTWLMLLTAAIIPLAALMLTVRSKCVIIDKGFWKPNQGLAKSIETKKTAYWVSVVFLALISVFFIWRLVEFDVVLYLAKVEMQTADGQDSDSLAACTGKAECVTVFLSPWCPHCRTSIPYLQSIQAALRNYPDVGFQIIVGWDSPEQNLAMAQAIGPETLIDRNEEFIEKMGIWAVPLVVVSDSENFILRSFGSWQHSGDSDTERLQFFNDNYLKLRSLK